jgi:hypothetical protein
MSLIALQNVVLADTGPFCRLAEAGEAPLDVAAEFLRDRVRVVLDVQEELRRRASVPVHGRLQRLQTLGVPVGDPITITDSRMLSRIDTIIEGRRRHKPGHEREDRGEVATALVAADMRVPALMDDGFGKRLAAQEGVDVFTTQDLAVELCARGLLRDIHAYSVYRRVYRNAQHSDFDVLVEAAKVSIAA